VVVPLEYHRHAGAFHRYVDLYRPNAARPPTHDGVLEGLEFWQSPHAHAHAHGLEALWEVAQAADNLQEDDVDALPSLSGEDIDRRMVGDFEE